MVSYELKPTYDNLKKSILGDYVGRNDGIVNFIKFLDVIDSSIAIALNDSWGSGKTFFVKQTQMVLQSYSNKNSDLTDVKNCFKKYFENYQIKNYLPVYYDAWSNDNDEDPVLSIVFKLLQSIDDLNQYALTDRNWWDVFTNGLEMLSITVGGPRVKNFLDSVKGENILGEIKKTKETEHVLNKIFDTLLQKQPEDTRIVFFIDELDRCCPNYAVRLLERIKHYFLHDKVIFVFSINEVELQHTIKRHYGNDFDADKYLHRFFDFILPLPIDDKRKFYQTINFDSSAVRWEIAKIVIEKYNFSLREITRYLQHLKVALLKKYSTDFQKEYGFYIEVLAPFLIGLSIHDMKKFHDFINGENMNCFFEIMEGEDVDWYCRILLDKDRETFVHREIADKEFVSLQETFKPVYECLFGKSKHPSSVALHGCEISSSDVKFIMEMIELQYAPRNLAGEKNGID